MEWIKTEVELPKAQVPVIVFGLNQHKKGRTMRAFYAPRWTIEDELENEYNASEYRENEDKFYICEGWYETNEHEEVNWMVGFPITHWMPLPAPPNSLT